MTRDEQRVHLFDTMLARFSPGRLVDLGAGHGTFSIRAAERGWQATAVDARTERFPDHDGVTWVNEDVRETDLSGFDLILNLGLLYHLTLEDQLSLFDRAKGTPMILDTHVGVEAERGYHLSPVVEEQGYRGRLYSEEGIQHVPTASFGNLMSFWPTPDSLIRMLTERGWTVCTAEPYYMTSRTFFLCLV